MLIYQFFGRLPQSIYGLMVITACEGSQTVECLVDWERSRGCAPTSVWLDLRNRAQKIINLQLGVGPQNRGGLLRRDCQTYVCLFGYLDFRWEAFFVGCHEQPFLSTNNQDQLLKLKEAQASCLS